MDTDYGHDMPQQLVTKQKLLHCSNLKVLLNSMSSSGNVLIINTAPIKLSINL